MNFLEYYYFESITREMSNITFGIEIEIPLKTNFLSAIHNFIKLNNNNKLKLEWDAGEDRSCPNCIEIRTYGGIPLSQLNNLKHDIDLIKKSLQNDIQLNIKSYSKQCGTHIHIGIDEEIANVIIDIWKNHLQKFIKLFITKDRFEAMKTNLYFKYMPINPIPLGTYNIIYRPTIKTLELRAKEATLNVNEIMFMIDLFANMIFNYKKLKKFFEKQSKENISYKDLLKIINQDVDEIKKIIKQKEKNNIKI